MSEEKYEEIYQVLAKYGQHMAQLAKFVSNHQETINNLNNKVIELEAKNRYLQTSLALSMSLTGRHVEEYGDEIKTTFRQMLEELKELESDEYQYILKDHLDYILEALGDAGSGNSLDKTYLKVIDGGKSKNEEQEGD